MLKYEPYNVSKIVTDISIASKEAILKKSTFNLILSGGRSTLEIISNLNSTKADFTKWVIIIVDERIVNYESNESNTNQIIKTLKKAGIKEYKLLSFYNNNKINLKQSLYDYSKINEIDYAVLGVGEDGHVASLFPKNEKINSIGEIIQISNSPKSPSNRITVTLNYLKKIKSGALLVLGEDKYPLLNNQTQKLPFQLLLKISKIKLYTDKDME